jgi:beta-mannosidase
MNMLRVWGGGIYEKDLFYDLCDSLGLMVWQDFMFACAMYPGDSIYINNVCEEIRQQVKRLRHHPCIALWCGNNENDEGWHNWGWQKDLAYTPKDSAKIYGDYLLLFEKLIPQILSQLDSSRSYHPSSPATGWGRPEAYQTGDVHYWGVWWGMEPLESYRKKTGRFVSEYGFQALPPAALLKKYLPENGFSLKSDALKNHQKHPTGFETIRKYMERDYKVPAPTEKYIYVSQLLQALAMETAIEAHRKSQPACMGSLFWQLNDCWPAISWSCTDFENHPKAAYYSIKNCFREIILVNERHNDKVFSFLVSDAPEKTPVKITVELVDFMGNIYYRKVVYQTAEYHTSRHCFTFPLSQLDENSIPAAASLVRYTMLINNSETRIQYFYFEKPKNLSLIDPGLKTEYAGINKVKVIATNYLAKNVFLYGDDIIFDDNFFDLLPGQSKTVTYNCLIPDSQTKSIIRAISLFDAMK